LKAKESTSASEVKVSLEQANAPAVSQDPNTLSEKSEASVGKSHFQSCKGWLGTNWAAIVSTCALLVSALALNATINSAAATRLHNKLSVRPDISFTFNANDNGAGWLWSINGAGLAIINAFEVTVDDKPVQTWEAVLMTLGIAIPDIISPNIYYKFAIPTP
jgi:hypothetical protein